MVTIIIMLLGCAVVRLDDGTFNVLSNRLGYKIFVQILIYIMLLVSIFSGADYLMKNKEILLDTKPNKKKR